MTTSPWSGEPISEREAWGELSDLARSLERFLSRHRQLIRAAEELHQAQRQIGAVQVAIERWGTAERWVGPVPDEGPLRTLIEALNRGFTRRDEVAEQNREAGRQIRSELDEAFNDAREAAEQAERCFVEATALLTTVRELQRLSGELHGSVASARETDAGAEAEEYDRWRGAAAAAIGELVQAAAESIENLGAGLGRVREIADQVHLIANRATLIALNVIVARSRAPETPSANAEGLAEELKLLTGEVRNASDHVATLSREVESDVRAASDRMRAIRERVAIRLEELPSAPGGSTPASEDLVRLLERVREMVQDATRKGERLSATGEGASRAAERLVRKLEEEAHDLEGLVVRLSAPGTEPTPAPVDPAARPSGLRVVGRPEAPGDARGERGREERS